MRKCLIVGGGIDALVAALAIKKSKGNFTVVVKTKNSDPRKYREIKSGATWAGSSPRQITYLESYNRNLFGINELLLRKKVSQGGWLGKENFSYEERGWLERRIRAQQFTKFNWELLKFYKGYNREAIRLWYKLMSSHANLFHNTKVKYGVDKKHHNNINVSGNYPEFTLSIRNFAINILDYLEESGVELQFDTQVDFNSIKDFPNVVIAVGAYDSELLKNTSVADRIFAIAGCWLIGNARGGNDNFQLRTEDLWQQNYSYIGSNKYVIGSGYAIAGFDTNSLCEVQKRALVDRSMELAEKFCDEVKPVDRICFRAFTDNDVPLLHVENNDNWGKTIIIGGMNTGTATAAPLTGQIVANALQGYDELWLKKLNLFNAEWTKLVPESCVR
ncbi:MAG: FAD-binding oxidoreductase [Rickettsiaceae bacterium H1]|nr:FAD-binding oxidoreductase [Rickettsiaceae bacterium H1]